MFVIIHSLLPVYWPNTSDCHTLNHDAWGQTYLHITFTASKCSSNTLELRSGVRQQAGRISCLRLNGNTTCLASSCVHWTNLNTLMCETTNNKLSVDGTNKTNIQAFTWTWVGFSTDLTVTISPYRSHLRPEGPFYMLREGRQSKYTLGNQEHTTSELWEDRDDGQATIHVSAMKSPPALKTKLGFALGLQQTVIFTIN